MDNKTLFYEVGKLAERDANSSIMWNVDGDQIAIAANCSDFFDWGTADCEEITAENFPVLQQAVSDIASIPGADPSDGFLLFCARVRNQRPQGAYYKYLTAHCRKPDGLNEYGNPKSTVDEEASERSTELVRELFNAAGPERKIDIWNPKDQDGVYRYTGEKAATN